MSVSASWAALLPLLRPWNKLARLLAALLAAARLVTRCVKLRFPACGGSVHLIVLTIAFVLCAQC